jgi:hypothetical protein
MEVGDSRSRRRAVAMGWSTCFRMSDYGSTISYPHTLTSQLMFHSLVVHDGHIEYHKGLTSVCVMA